MARSTFQKTLIGIAVTALVLVVLAVLNGAQFYLNMKARDGKASTATVSRQVDAEKDSIIAKLDSLEHAFADTVRAKKSVRK